MGSRKTRSQAYLQTIPEFLQKWEAPRVIIVVCADSDSENGDIIHSGTPGNWLSLPLRALLASYLPQDVRDSLRRISGTSGRVGMVLFTCGPGCNRPQALHEIHTLVEEYVFPLPFPFRIPLGPQF